MPSIVFSSLNVTQKCVGGRGCAPDNTKVTKHSPRPCSQISWEGRREGMEEEGRGGTVGEGEEGWGKGREGKGKVEGEGEKKRRGRHPPPP